MGSYSLKKITKTVIHVLPLPVVIALAAVSFAGVGSEWPATLMVSAPLSAIAELRDFREQEVKGVGFRLNRDVTLRVSALGGGSKSFWRDVFEGDDRPMMYASGWIINADTRDVVWEMTYDNTSGPSEQRRFDADVSLPKGSYEVYYAAYAFAKKFPFSNTSTNIDRRPGKREGESFGNRVLRVFGADNENLYDEFMELAKDWGISLTVSDADAASVERFQVPLETQKSIFAAQKLGDGVVIRKSLVVDKELPIHIYAVGEGRRREGMFDYGWIVRRDTRERVWEMTDRNSRPAGGVSKNRKFNGDATLAKGDYELYFITDDSHSSDDWNSQPPSDPFRYGITVTLKNEADRSFVRVGETNDSLKNVIVQVTQPDDNDYLSAGFSLKSDAKVRIYAFGERDSREELADYGWIVNARTKQHVWDMKRRPTYHGGGAQKNRLVDEVIALPKGDYIAYYQTDGSHSYIRWNADPPFDEERYGLTVMGVGDNFDMKSVSKLVETEEKGVLTQIIRVGDNQSLRKSFSLDKPTKVRIYALGEGQDRRMYDYGWIENKNTGVTVWEMTYGMTNPAGGARKNRMVSTTLLLDKGEYELRYETDGSHSFNDWNAPAPEDRTHWGITLYRDSEN